MVDLSSCRMLSNPFRFQTKLSEFPYPPSDPKLKTSQPLKKAGGGQIHNESRTRTSEAKTSLSTACSASKIAIRLATILFTNHMRQIFQLKWPHTIKRFCGYEPWINIFMALKQVRSLPLDWINQWIREF